MLCNKLNQGQQIGIRQPGEGVAPVQKRVHIGGIVFNLLGKKLRRCHAVPAQKTV